MSATRLVIGIIGAALLAALAGIITLAGLGHTIPDVLQNVAVGSLTGLVGLLVPNKAVPAPSGPDVALQDDAAA